MRLLTFKEGRLSLTKNFYSNIPLYAILSHTWGDEEEEVGFQEVEKNTGQSKLGYEKIQFCRDQAARDGLNYFWIDTCCIDQCNSTELQEAITSMYRWYQNANKCYVYLSDVKTDSGGQFNRSSAWETAFRKSRWFQRGWTLQELLAPQVVEFFSVDGEPLGNKTSLERQVSEITGIPIQALRGDNVSQFGPDEIMQWARKRQTKREEDQIYSLLGLLGINMPIIYGEGRESALKRLRREIKQQFIENNGMLSLFNNSSQEFTILNRQPLSTVSPNGDLDFVPTPTNISCESRPGPETSQTMRLVELHKKCLAALDDFEDVEMESYYRIFQSEAEKLRKWGEAVLLRQGKFVDSHNKTFDYPQTFLMVENLLAVILKICIVPHDAFQRHRFENIISRNQVWPRQSVQPESNSSRFRDKVNREAQVELLRSLVQTLQSLVPSDRAEGPQSSQRGPTGPNNVAERLNNAPVANIDCISEFQQIRIKKQQEIEANGRKAEELRELRNLLGSEECKQHVDTQEYWTVQGRTKEGQIHSRNTADDDFTNKKKARIGPGGVTEEQQPFVAGYPTLLPTQVSLASRQSLVYVHTLTRSLCRSVTCACACHLGRYYKSPLFLKRFIGALSFKGVCRNHPAKSLELKYWVPKWISNYNIHLWFEQNVCGTPSFGLKLQRKVDWGSEDTIIRFSYLGDTEGIKTILQSGRASLDDVDPNHGLTPLHKKHVQACNLLLQIGADRFVEDKTGMSATQKAWEHILTNRGAPEVLDMFKTLFPDVDLECWQFSPLHKALLGIDGLCLPEQLKIDAHFDMINATDARRRTALHWAALRGDLKAVELLLDADADVDAVDEFKCTPLVYAVSSANSRMIELLILNKADVNFTNNRGDTPLHYAARHSDDVESVKVLIQAGARVDRKNSLGNTPFAGAAITNRLSSGKYLLQKGADRHSKNKYGDTPLRETIHHNCHEFLQMLLQTGTKYDDINGSGNTILHALALEGDNKTASILKASKITELDTQLRNAKGKTAMDICQERIGAPEGFKNAFSELLATLSTVW